MKKSLEKCPKSKMVIHFKIIKYIRELLFYKTNDVGIFNKTRVSNTMVKISIAVCKDILHKLL